jgi:hypothetical protein
MRTMTFTFTVRISRATGLALAAVMALLTAGLLFGLSALDVNATHDATGNVHACVSLYTGQARVMFPGQAPNCTASERLVEWPGTALAADLAELEARLEELACIQSAPGANSAVDDIVFIGCNVQIVNGLGDTETTNELGNLIVGYNEDLNGFTRTGSHNLVVGQGHGYSSYAGFVAGRGNQISGPHSSVSGGEGNIASGAASSISGGSFSTASDFAASVSGGFNNIASGDDSSVSGGFNRNTNNIDPTHDWRGGSLIEDD